MKRSTWIWVGGLIVLVIAAIALTAVRRPAVYPVSSPEGVVQRYLQAVFDRDPLSASSWLAPSLKPRCENALDDVMNWGPSEDRATLIDSRIDGDQASVRVSIGTSGGLLDPGYERTVSFHLRLLDEGWRIDRSPWPVEYCAENPDLEG